MVLQSAGGLLAATGLTRGVEAITAPLAQGGAARAASPSDVTARVTRYMAEARERSLPSEVTRFSMYWMSPNWG